MALVVRRATLAAAICLFAASAQAEDAAERPPAVTSETSKTFGSVRLLLVVGNNRPAEASQTVLRYADDDAARYYERFDGLADTRILLTRFDDDSRIYREAYGAVARPPTWASLAGALAELRTRAKALRAQGRFVEFVFVFAGHGGQDRGAPYLALEDGRIGRDELERTVIDGMPADLTHVVIDACSAASFVTERGPMRGDRRALPDRLLPFGGIVERHPRVGFVVAASPDGRAFEWSRFGSGVASHLIRSALSGAADASPPDGRVTYDELDAFVRTARQGLLASEFRQEVTIVPPRALPSAAVVDFTGASTPVLVVDRPGRYYVRDADGHRVADLRAGQTALRLFLPPYSPRFSIVEVAERGPGCAGPVRARSGGCTREEHAAEFEAQGIRRLSELELTTPTVATRGVIEDSAFEGLFGSPFDSRAAAEDSAQREAPPVRAPESLPSRSLSLGYRGVVGALMKELGPMHGFEVRLELPVARRFVVAPVAGAGRGTAKPAGAPEYPVYEAELGAEAAWVPWLNPVILTLGVEARVQWIDQVPPYASDRSATSELLGAMARARVPLNPLVGVGGGLGGGARLVTVDGSRRVRPYAALVLAVSAEL